MIVTFEPFTAGVKKQVKKAKPKAVKPPALENAPGKIVNDGKTIEWAHGNFSAEVTLYEVEMIKRLTKCRTVKMFRANQIKSMMNTKTVAEMAKALRCSERTVWGIKNALLVARGGG